MNEKELSIKMIMIGSKKCVSKNEAIKSRGTEFLYYQWPS
jgi:hypothetical protein